MNLLIRLSAKEPCGIFLTMLNYFLNHALVITCRQKKNKGTSHSLGSPTQAEVFLCFDYFLHWRAILKTTKL